MHFRLTTVILLSCISDWAIANNNVWDCEQGMDGKWVCAGQDEPDPQIQTETPLETIQMQQVEPVSEPPIMAYPRLEEPPKKVIQQQGWTCSDDDQEDGVWSCSLVGADPKGQARVMGDAGQQDSWLTPAFNFSEEQTFALLHNRLPYDPWEGCETEYSEENRQQPTDKSLRQQLPMDVHADYSEVFDKEISSFYGNVDIRRADQQISADRVTYDSVSETLDAQGQVIYTENELALFSASALLKINSDEARLRDAFFILPEGGFRGRADAVYRDNKSLSRYTSASITSCPPKNQDWVVHADRFKMNRQTGKGAARHAWLEFKKVPIFYTPYISFPLDDRRLSGFLAPTWGSTEKNGFDFELPIYWNIAPNYDVIFTPRYMSKRGGMLRSEFRYLTEMSRGQVGLEYMPVDTRRDESRYSASIQSDTLFLPGLSSHLDLNYVSDDDYFNDLNNALGFSNTRHLRSLADLRYQQEWLNFSAKLEHYQTIDRAIASDNKPYQKYPQVSLNLRHDFADLPINLAMENEYSYFYRSQRVKGHRINLKPSISFPLRTAAGFIVPKFSVQHTEYYLQDQEAGKADDISRTLPIVSVDGGLVFEKDLQFAGNAFQHTLEPRLFYLYIPKDDQSDIPLFDTAEYDLNFHSLFRENRFNGMDRIQDANQVTLALTSRLLDSETGEERLKLSVGEIFYIQDREVQLSGNQTDPRDFSNLIAELSGKLTDHWSFSSMVQWNLDQNDISRGQAYIRYRNLPGEIINLGYRYRRDDLDAPASIIQSDMSFRWPLYDDWYAVGRWQYSLKFNQTTESFLGLEKESCCWRFRIIGRRYVNSISDSIEAEAENGVFVQIEFKGLAGFGDKVDEFLERNLSGYRKPVDD